MAPEPNVRLPEIEDLFVELSRELYWCKLSRQHSLRYTCELHGEFLFLFPKKRVRVGKIRIKKKCLSGLIYTVNVDLFQLFSRREMAESRFGCSVYHAMDTIKHVQTHCLGFGNICHKWFKDFFLLETYLKEFIRLACNGLLFKPTNTIVEG